MEPSLPGAKRSRHVSPSAGSPPKETGEEKISDVDPTPFADWFLEAITTVSTAALVEQQAPVRPKQHEPKGEFDDFYQSLDQATSTDSTLEQPGECLVALECVRRHLVNTSNDALAALSAWKHSVPGFIASIYARWIAKEHQEIQQKLNELLALMAVKSTTASLVLFHLVVRNMPHADRERFFSEQHQWTACLHQLTDEATFQSMMENKWATLIKAVQRDYFLQSIENDDGDTGSGPQQQLQQFLIILIDQAVQLFGLGNIDDPVPVLRLVFGCAVLGKRFTAMVDSEGFRLEVAAKELVMMIRLNQQTSLTCIQNFGAELSPFPASGFAKTPQNALFRLVKDLMVGEPPLLLSSSPGITLTGEIRDWIPTAQTLIDNTRYDATRIFCDQLVKLERGDDRIGIAALRFVMAENQRMQLYMDIVNDRRSTTSIEVGLVEQLYREAINPLEMAVPASSSSSSSSSAPFLAPSELVKASLSLGLARLLMEEERLDEAQQWQRRAFENRLFFLGADDPLTVQAMYAGAEISHKRASMLFRDDPVQVDGIVSELQNALEVLDMVEPKWKLARKYAFIATLREKRAEILATWSQVDLHLLMSPKNARSKLQEAITNLQRCYEARLEIFGSDHLRYKRARDLADSFIVKLDLIPPVVQ